jgi:sugar phosphate isomerase/epimerase
MNGFSPLLYVSTSAVEAKSAVEAVKALSAAGINQIELTGGHEYNEGYYDTLLNIKKELGLKYLFHGYFPPPLHDFVLNFADTSGKTRNFIAESMKYVNGADVPYYSVHSGFKKDFTQEGELLFEDGERTFPIEGIYENIRWFNNTFPGKRLAIENLYPNNNDLDACYLSHINEITDFLEKSDGAYLLLDIGHLNVSAHILKFDFLRAVETLLGDYSDKILEIHLSENDSLVDDHFLITQDGIQYSILKRFKDRVLKQLINVTLETRGATIREVTSCVGLLNEALTG